MKFASLKFPLFILSACLLAAPTPAATQTRRKQSPRRQHPRPNAAAPEVRLDPGASSARFPFDLVSDLVLIRVGVGGSTPLWFILDTGASNTVIDAAAAKSLGLTARGGVTANGTAGSATAGVVRGASLSVPGASARGLTVYTLPLDFLSPPLGRRVSGVLGNDFLKRFVVEIDYAAREVRLHDPAAYKYEGSGSVLPMTFEADDNLYLRATVKPRGRAPVEGRFQLDTGSTGALTLYTRFVDRHRLLQTVTTSRKEKLGGVGGSGDAITGRVEGLRLGGFELKDIVTRFSRARSGDAGGASYDGLIGGEIFRRFTAIFDYSRGRLILEPNASHAEPFEEDMSGLSLVGDGDDFSVYLVDDVDADSPAALAGVRGGDVLVEIDGRPAADLGLERIREMFRREGPHALTLRRDGKTVHVQLKTVRAL